MGVTKLSVTTARFVTKEVVTNRAGIVPLIIFLIIIFKIYLNISTCDIVCERACVRACVCVMRACA